MFKLVTALLAGAALTPCPCLAQQSASQTLPNVEIVAPTDSSARASPAAGAGTLNYTPVPAETIAADSAASPDAASLLGDVPGVSLKTGGGVSSLPVIHGFDDERNAILLGGMSITAACPNHMNPALSYIDSANVGSVQVITTNVPVSMGGDSIGGAIIVNPRAPVFAPVAGAPAASGLPTLAIAPGVAASGSLTTMYRSNNKSVTLSGTASVATDHFSIGYDGSWSHGSDYHAGGNNAVAPSTSYAAENHAVTLAYKNDDQLITLRGAIQHDPFEGFPNEYMDMLNNQASSVNLDYKGGFGWGQLDADAFYQHTQHYMNFGSDKDPAGVTTTTGMPMWTDGQDFGYSIKGTIAASQIDTIRVGNEFHGETLNDWWTPNLMKGTTTPWMMCCGTFENIHDGTRDRFAAYSEWERKWTPQWTTLLGVRGEIVDANTGDVQGYNTLTSGMSSYMGTATYPSGYQAFNALNHAKTFDDLDWTALTRYTPNADTTYEAGVTQKTRAPSLYELYAWSTNSMAAEMNGWGGDGDGYVGNLYLKPEIAHTLSVSVDWRDATSDRWEFKATPYYSYVQDYIDVNVLTPDATKGGVITRATDILQYANHNAELYGFDLSGRVRLAESENFGVVTLSGEAGYTRGINLDTHGNLYEIMPLNGKAALSDKIALWGGTWINTVELQAVAAKTEVDAVTNELTTPAYALTNLRSAYEYKNIRFDFGVENLFDKFYYEPLGGADIAQWKIDGYNTVAPDPVAGMGRTLYGGMTVKF